MQMSLDLSARAGALAKLNGRRVVGEAGGGTWSTPSRPRVDKHPTQTKLRWERAA